MPQTTPEVNQDLLPTYAKELTTPIHTNGAGAPEPEQPPDPPTPEHLTDLGNARRFTRLHGHDLRYTQATGWLVWTGSHWQKDETGHVSRLAKAVVMGLHYEAAAKLEEAAALQKQIAAMAVGDPRREKMGDKFGDLMDIGRSMAAWAKKSQGRDKIAAMIALAETELPIATHIEQFDKNPWLFNLKNGTVDLKTGKLHPHKRTDLITVCSDATFDPNAVCPKFVTFVKRIMQGNDNLIGFIQRAMGYTLTGVVETEDLFFSYGTGGNGKSTFFNIITAILGAYFKKLPFSSLAIKRERGGANNDLAMLRGARMVLSSEVKQDSELDAQLINDLTGRDRVSVRYLFKEFFDLEPSFKLWIYGNHKPKIKDREHGIWRRVHLIPFIAEIPESEKDPKLQQKIIDQELSGVLNWLIAGCLEWQQKGLAIPDEVKAATNEYKAEGDTLTRFIEECAVTHADAKVKAGRLQEKYVEFCRGEGLKALRGNELWIELEKLGIKKRRTTLAGVQYEGIGLLEPEISENNEK